MLITAFVSSHTYDNLGFKRRFFQASYVARALSDRPLDGRR